MELAVRTVNSHSRLTLQVLSLGRGILVKAMGHQVPSDTQLGCKGAPQVAWVPCPTVHRYMLLVINVL